MAATHDERLRVPIAWWPGVLTVVVIGVFEVGAGFEWRVVALVAIGMLALFALPLALSGRARVRVSDGVIEADGKLLSLDDVIGAVPLDRRAARMQLGPRADPAAVVVQRGWVSTAVVVPLRNPDPVPYWYISSRRPEQLSAAITAAMPASQR